MKCQNLFSWRNKKKHIICFSSAELAKRVVMVNSRCRLEAICGDLIDYFWQDRLASLSQVILSGSLMIVN